jgi:ethanolamine ammonia-lyase large subunit
MAENDGGTYYHMARWHCNIGARSHEFNSLCELMAKATPLRSGDELAGVAASSAEERVAAQFCLADVPLKQFLEEPLVPVETDEVTRLILDQHDPSAFEMVGPTIDNLHFVKGSVRQSTICI